MATGGHDGFGEAATKYWPIAAGLAAAGWTSFKAWLSGRKAKDREAKALIAAAALQRGELVEIAQKAAKDVIKILTDENARLSKEVDDLRFEFKELQISTAKALMTKDNELMLLRGDLRQALSFAGSYDRLLTEHSIPHEKPSKPFWEIVGNEVHLVEREEMPRERE